MTTEHNKAIVHRWFTLLAIVAILALTFATVSTRTVSAHSDHGSCAAFGAQTAANAPHGEDARSHVPLGDLMAVALTVFCEPRP